MTNPYRNDVSAVLAAVDDLVPRVDTRTLELYVEEIVRWNPQLGLVSKRNTPQVIARLFRESVALWDFVTAAAAPAGEAIGRVVDIGSGAGFPGLVWSMLDPGLSVELLERRARKVTFLDRVIARSANARVEATAEDLRDFARRTDSKASFDLAVMMAVADPADIAASVESLLRTSGFFCVVRGREQTDPGERLGVTKLFRKSAQETPNGRFLLYELRR
jgi:16S rRNA (guanine527-N7)-methyltransferase